MKSLLFASGFMLIMILVNGQDNPIDTTYTLPDVSVMASRIRYFTTGLNIRKFDSLTMNMNRDRNLGELLSDYSSVQINTYQVNGLSTIAFRGTSTQHTGIYWNGFAINPPNNGLVDLSLIPAGFFSDISVLHGGASSLFGSGNIGGSILLENEPQFTKTKGISAGFTAGSFGEYNGNLSVQLSSGKWFSRSGISVNTSKNNFEYKDLKKETVRQTNSKSEQYGFMQDLYRNLNDHSILGASVWMQWNRHEIPATLTSKPSDASEFDHSVRTSVSWKKFFRKNNIEIKTAYLSDFLHYTDPDKTSSSEIDSKINTGKSISEVRYTNGSIRHLVISSGLNFTWEQGNSINWDGNVDERTVGLFAMLNRNFLAIGWRVDLNLRQDLAEGYIVPFTPSFGAEGKLLPFLSAKINVAKNFRIPTFNDRYWIPGGNENLKPENSWNEEVSLLFNPFRIRKKFSGELIITAFNSNVDDWIIWIPTGSYSSPENIKKVWSRGFEAEGNLNFSIKQLKVYIKGGYTFVRSTSEAKLFTNDNSYKKQLIYVPENRFYTNVTLQFKSFNISYNQSFIGIRYVTSDNNGFLPAYSTANLYLGKNFQFDKHGLYFQGEILNLWNVRYEAVLDYPMPGRSFKFTIRYTFNKN